MKRLAIVSTHPIQYNAPIFRLLNNCMDIELLVFYTKTWNHVKYDPDFQRDIKWDIPLDTGYKHYTTDASSPKGKIEIIKEIQKFQPQAVMVYGWNPPGHLHLMRRFYGHIPIWFRGDSHLLDPLPVWKKLLRRKFLSWVYKHVDLAFTVGTANEEYYKWCGLEDKNLIRANHAVDIKFFQEKKDEHKQNALRIRRSLGINDFEKVILFAGKLEPKKQPDKLLEAWSRFKGIKPHVIMVGSGQLEKKLRETWGDTKQVHFIGFQNQQAMPAIYRTADVVCLPSKGPGETWGLTINEAFACEIPCIVSNRAGCYLDICNHTDLCRIVQWDEPENWAEIISDLIHIPRENQDWASVHTEFNLDRLVTAVRQQLALTP